MLTVKLKRGILSELPILDCDEICFVSDIKKLYIGSPDGNKEYDGPMDDLQILYINRGSYRQNIKSKIFTKQKNNSRFKIILRRGQSDKTPNLSFGEIVYLTDLKTVCIGTEKNGNLIF